MPYGLGYKPPAVSCVPSEHYDEVTSRNDTMVLDDTPDLMSESSNSDYYEESQCPPWFYLENDYNDKSPETRDLSPEERYAVIMKRTCIGQFLDPRQAAQCLWDEDLLEEWEENQKRKEDLAIRHLVKASHIMFSRPVAIAAAEQAIQNIYAFALELSSSVFHNRIWVAGRPVTRLLDLETRRPCHVRSRAYYPRLFQFPKYTEKSSQYDPQAEFWILYRKEIFSLPSPTSPHHLPIIERLGYPISLDPLMMRSNADEGVRDYVDRRICLDVEGYPSATKLQTEQLTLLGWMFFVLSHLFSAFFKEDLAQQLQIYDILEKLIRLLRSLSQHSYNVCVLADAEIEEAKLEEARLAEDKLEEARLAEENLDDTKSM